MSLDKKRDELKQHRDNFLSGMQTSKLVTDEDARYCAELGYNAALTFLLPQWEETQKKLDEAKEMAEFYQNATNNMSQDIGDVAREFLKGLKE